MKKVLLLCLLLFFTSRFYAQVYTIGTGTTVGANNTGAGTQLTPFKTWYGDGRAQYLYHASELTAAGASSSGGYVTGIGFNVVAASSSLPMSNFNIKIKNTTTTALTTTFETGLTTAFSGTYNVIATSWQSIAFTTPFYWDGTSNILIEICYDNNTYSTNSTVDNSASGFNSNHYTYDDGATGCSMTTNNNGVTATRPNIQFTIIPKPVVPNVSNSGAICPGFDVNLTGTGLAPGGNAITLSGSQPDVSNQVIGATGNNFTMEFWVQPTSTRAIIAEGNGLTTITGTSGQRYVIYPFWGGLAALNQAGAGVSVGTNGIAVYEHADGYLTALLTYDQTITGWTHVAVVYASRTPYLYINGVLAYKGLQSQKGNVYPTVGSGGTSSNYGPFTGKLDNVRIWNSALTATQIQSIMFYSNATISGATLLAHYTYDGSTVTDGAGLNGAWNTPAAYPTADYFTYTWSGGANPPAASINETQTTGVLVSSPQVYTVTATALGATGAPSASNTVIVICPLPIELINFKASCDGAKVQLHWATATETHNDFFTIERSYDAANWEQIAKVNGAGNSIVAKTYGFTDENISGQPAYYRLSQTDYDGSTQTFDMISTDCADLSAEMRLAPNPASKALNVLITVQQDYNPCIVQIVDAFGQTVLEQKAMLSKGENTISLNLQLLPGMYSVKLIANNLNSPAQRLIVQ